MRELVITKGILEAHMEELLGCLESDVVIVGGGPSGLVGGSILARKGFTVTLLEKRLSPGGGIWGGGMGFKYIVVQEEVKDVLEDFGIPYTPYEEGMVRVDAIGFGAGLIFGAVRSGVHIFNLTEAEDLLLREGRVIGVVINNSLARLQRMPMDPITIEAKAVVDATGHDHEVVKTLARKNDVRLETPTGEIAGERSLYAESAERAVVENTREVYPGLFVAGMATASVFGSHRMGPIFGGMLLSGKRLAEILEDYLRG